MSIVRITAVGTSFFLSGAPEADVLSFEGQMEGPTSRRQEADRIYRQ